MCFKKPKMPPPTQEEIQAEAELKGMRDRQKQELALQKQQMLERSKEEIMAMRSGRYGYRSLITGGQGGAGYVRNLIG